MEDEFDSGSRLSTVSIPHIVLFEHDIEFHNSDD